MSIETKNLERAKRIEEIMNALGQPAAPQKLWEEYAKRGYEGEELTDVQKAVLHKVLQTNKDRFERVGKGLWTLKAPTIGRVLEDILIRRGGQADLATIYQDYEKVTGKDTGNVSGKAVVRSCLINSKRGHTNRFYSSKRGVWAVRGCGNKKGVIDGIIEDLKNKGLFDDVAEEVERVRAEEERKEFRTMNEKEFKALLKTLRDRIVEVRDIDGDPSWLQNVDKHLKDAEDALGGSEHA